MGTLHIGVVQVDFEPAFSSEGEDFLGEPDAAHAASSPTCGLFALVEQLTTSSPTSDAQSAQRVLNWRRALRDRYTEILSRKVQIVLEFAVKHSIDILVFPEYSMLCKVLANVRAAAAGLYVVAGTHTIEGECVTTDCQALGIRHTEKDVGKAVCPILCPDGTVHVIHKFRPSRYDATMVPGTLWKPLRITKNSVEFEVRVTVCLDFLDAELGAHKPYDGADKPLAHIVFVVPALTPTDTDDFHHKALDYVKRKGHTVAFANASIYGRSRIYYESAADGLPMQDQVGGWTAAKDEEVLLAATVAPSRGGRFTRVPSVQTKVRQTVVAPLYYPAYPEREDRVVNLQQLPLSNLRALPAVSVAPSSSLSSTLAKKLQHLSIRRQGISENQAQLLREAIILPGNIPPQHEWRYRALFATARFLAKSFSGSVAAPRIVETAQALHDWATVVAHSAGLPYQLTQLPDSLSPEEILSDATTAAMRLGAYPSSGQVDSVLAEWVNQAAQQENVDTSFVAAVVGLVTGLRPYPSRALEQRLLPLLKQGTAGRAEIGRVCTQHIETCRACHEMLAERAKSERLLVDGHYVVYGYSGGIIRLLKDFARDFFPDNLTVAVVECKNRMDIDSAPSQIYELRRSAFRCHYIPVTSLARYVSEHSPTRILMGANLLVPDGVLNTIGSLSVVLVASRHNTPVSIIAPSYKAWNAEQFNNERGKVMTMQRPSDRAYAHLGLGTELFTQVINYAYDLVPVEPPVSVFTEKGVFGTEGRSYSSLFLPQSA